jgi:putative addiction module component (TIGR02574 family)
METVISKLTDQALSLPAIDRVHLADRLLESLNSPGNEKINKLWAEEAERRIDELDSGEVQAIPGEKVFADIRKRLAK